MKTSAYGENKPQFWLAEYDAPHGKLHIAFVARDRFGWDAIHREVLAVGGTDNGTTGYRPHRPGYYAAFVLDPDGNNIEAVFLDACQIEEFKPPDGL